MEISMSFCAFLTRGLKQKILVHIASKTLLRTYTWLGSSDLFCYIVFSKKQYSVFITRSFRITMEFMGRTSAKNVIVKKYAEKWWWIELDGYQGWLRMAIGDFYNNFITFYHTLKFHSYECLREINRDWSVAFNNNP